jgi:hypothetical protein
MGVTSRGFTLTCASGAQGKCVRFADYHQACIRLVRADYCGNQGTTKDGMLIDVYDKIGIWAADEAADPSLRFKAAWDANGAICVAHTRVPENVTLERLAEECPRLRGHLGESACRRARLRQATSDSGYQHPRAAVARSELTAFAKIPVNTLFSCTAGRGSRTSFARFTEMI